MKVKVVKENCIGCGACQAIAPNIFEMDENGLSKVVAAEVTAADEADCKDAIESCPTAAIFENTEE